MEKVFSYGQLLAATILVAQELDCENLGYLEEAQKILERKSCPPIALCYIAKMADVAEKYLRELCKDTIKKEEVKIALERLFDEYAIAK